MPIYKAPVEDVNFLLNDVFQIDRYDNLPGFSDASADLREAVLSEAAKLSEEVLQPLNRVGDIEGCIRHDDGSVTTPKGFKQAFKQVAEGGWLGLSAPTEYGGQGLPVTLSHAVTEFQCSANMAFAMYGGLTMGATAALIVHGKPDQKKMFVPKMVAGEWTGTMNLTEPQCGTDLGLLRTKAVKQGDGSYKITGTKIFISSGEHDLSDNIIHLVLARIDRKGHAPRRFPELDPVLHDVDAIERRHRGRHAYRETREIGLQTRGVLARHRDAIDAVVLERARQRLAELGPSGSGPTFGLVA